MSENFDADDFPVDVCISRPNGEWRFKLPFRSSKPLIETLVAWQAQGHADIWISWGATTPDARERVESALARAGVAHTTAPGSDEPPPTRAGLLLGAVVGVVGFAGLIYSLTDRANEVGDGMNKVAEEQRERDEQNRKAMARSFDAMKARTFRELEDADPAVRLQAISLVADLYTSDPQTVPALVKRVKDTDRRVRVAAVAVLGKTRTKSDEALAALRGCLADEDEQVRAAATAALAKLK